MFKNGMRPVHPGEVLREDYLVPLEMSANALAKALNVPAPRVNDIVRERRGVSADTAMRLARYFGKFEAARRGVFVRLGVYAAIWSRFPLAALRALAHP